MAEFRSITPRNLFRDQYIPENDPAWREGQDRFSTNPILGTGERAVDAYRQLKSNSAIDVYRFALANGKSEEEAQALAQQVLRGAERSELIASILAPEALGAGVGKVTSGIGKAVDMAKGLFGGSRAAEPQALLAAPRRNAMFADEMLDIEPPAPTYSGPRRLESGEFLPRIDIPRVQSSGITARDVVSSPFDDIGRMVGEGGQADETIEAARRMVRDRIAAEEAFRARQADTMVGEGGTAPNEAARLRALKAAEDAALTARQMGTAEGEGMATADAVDAARAIVQGRLEAQAAAHQARLDRMADDGAGMAMQQPMERGALPAGSPPSSNYPVPALRGSTEPSVLPGLPNRGSAGPMGGGGGGGTGGGSSAPNPSFDLGGPRMSASESAPSGGRTFSAEELAKIRRDMILNMGMLTAGTAGLGYGFGHLHNRGQSQPSGGSVPTSSAPSAPNMRPMDSTLFGEDVGPRPAPMRQMDSTLFGEDAGNRPAPMRAVDSSIFGESPRGQTSGAPSRSQAAAAVEAAKAPASRALWEAYNRSMMDEGGGRGDLFVRADRAEMEGRARGGVARNGGGAGGKDAALHKALEIIQHMLVNR